MDRQGVKISSSPDSRKGLRAIWHKYWHLLASAACFCLAAFFAWMLADAYVNEGELVYGGGVLVCWLAWCGFKFLFKKKSFKR